MEFLDEPFIFFPVYLYLYSYIEFQNNCIFYSANTNFKYTHSQELQRDITIYKKALDHLLYYGDVLCIEGFVNETQNAHFSIALMHESSEFSKKSKFYELF